MMLIPVCSSDLSRWSTSVSFISPLCLFLCGVHCNVVQGRDQGGILKSCPSHCQALLRLSLQWCSSLSALQMFSQWSTCVSFISPMCLFLCGVHYNVVLGRDQGGILQSCPSYCQAMLRVSLQWCSSLSALQMFSQWSTSVSFVSPVCLLPLVCPLQCCSGKGSRHHMAVMSKPLPGDA